MKLLPSDPRRKAWVSAALLCLPLLLVPTLVCVALPKQGSFKPAPPNKGAARFVGGMAEDDDESADRPARHESAEAPEADAADDGVAGIVVDQTGKPVKGATVGCEDDVAAHEVQSDADGHFTLPADAAGCKAVAMHAEFGASDSARAEVGKPNRYELKAGGGIEGIVVDDHGLPIIPFLLAVESFTPAVQRTPKPAPPVSAALKTARTFDTRNASFVLDKLAPGKYVLTASAEGRPPTQSETIEVESGRTARRVKIVLRKGVKLAGRILDAETHKPVAKAVVELADATQTQANSIRSATSDERGAYVLEAVPSSFTIRVAHADYRTTTVTGTASGAGATQDVELALRGDAGDDAEQPGGIGAQIWSYGTPRVLVLDAGGPAATAGLAVGDQVATIDGLPVKGMPANDIAKRLQGNAHTVVRVGVERGGAKLEFSITRAPLPAP